MAPSGPTATSDGLNMPECTLPERSFMSTERRREKPAPRGSGEY